MEVVQRGHNYFISLSFVFFLLMCCSCLDWIFIGFLTVGVKIVSLTLLPHPVLIQGFVRSLSVSCYAMFA